MTTVYCDNDLCMYQENDECQRLAVLFKVDGFNFSCPYQKEKAPAGLPSEQEHKENNSTVL